jgi:hypothetical protein
MSVVIQSIHEGTGAYLVKFICSWIPVRTTLQQNNTYYLLNILPISYTVYYKMSKSVFKTRISLGRFVRAVGSWNKLYKKVWVALVLKGTNNFFWIQIHHNFFRIRLKIQ